MKSGGEGREAEGSSGSMASILEVSKPRGQRAEAHWQSEQSGWECGYSGLGLAGKLSKWDETAKAEVAGAGRRVEQRGGFTRPSRANWLARPSEVWSITGKFGKACQVGLTGWLAHQRVWSITGKFGKACGNPFAVAEEALD